jgi:hypothetical protein
MVKPRSSLLVISIALVLMCNIATISAQWTGTYHLEHKWVKIWINQDGTIDLFYDIHMAHDSGDPINYEVIGQPTSDFETGQAIDQYGHILETSDIIDERNKLYQVEIKLFETLMPGQSIRFNITTNVADMIWEDTTNPDNVGMEFTPYWEPAVVYDLRILIVLPSGVNQDMVKTTDVLWNNTLIEDGRLAIYWEKQNLPPNERYWVGVSFPKEYVQSYNKQPSGIQFFLEQYAPILLILGLLVAVIGVVLVVIRKRKYIVPKLSVETLGLKRGLTAVEASYLLGGKPTKIVTMILYGLLKKRAIWVESTTPSLKIRIIKKLREEEEENMHLRYYEIDFLDAIREDGFLDEQKLANTVMFLRDTVEQKMRGYRRSDTNDYYRKIAIKAWEEVIQSGTPELASNAYNEQLLWLFLDPNYQERTQTVFQDKDFTPNPLWFWYWYSYQHYHPNPTYKPNIENPDQAAKPPTIPGAELANNIASALENTSRNIVANIEKFANAIIPKPTTAKASRRPAHHKASCVCACAACACACACVSCACACAGGGARIRGG